MSDPFVPLGFRGPDYTFDKAFKLDRKGILGFVDNLSKNPAKYGVPKNHEEYLKLLHPLINELRCSDDGKDDGSRYRTPPPPIQSLRSGPDNLVASQKLEPTKAIPWDHNNKSQQFYTIFDLLGVFLTLTGPAPTGATDKNYFLPLLAVYANWCLKLSPGGSLDSDAPSGFAPNKVQVTWATTNGVTYAFLGAVARGFGSPTTKGRNRDKWRVRVQEGRFDYLKHMLEDKYQKFGKDPLPEVDGKKAEWPFGNCAETFPFLYILDTIKPSDTAPKEISHGFCLVVAEVWGLKDKYKGSDLWNDVGIDPPCPNCKYLIQRYKIPIKNYDPDVPKKPST